MGKVILTAAVGGLCSAALYLAVLGSIGALVLGYFAPLPLFLVGLSAGNLAVMAAGAVAAAGVGAFTGNPAVAGVFLVSVSIPVALVIRLALLSRVGADGRREWCPPGPLLMSLTLYGLSGVLGTMGFALMGGQGLDVWIQGMLKTGLAPILEGTPGIGTPSDSLDALVETLAMVFSAMAVASWLVMLSVNGALAQGLLSRWGMNRRPGAAMASLELPVWMAGMPLLIIPAALLPGETVGILARNILLILLVPFLFLGLAALHRLAARGGASRTVLLVAMYLFILFVGWPVVLVIGLGLIEHGLGLRRRTVAACPDKED